MADPIPSCRRGPEHVPSRTVLGPKPTTTLPFSAVNYQAILEQPFRSETARKWTPTFQREMERRPHRVRKRFRGRIRPRFKIFELWHGETQALDQAPGEDQDENSLYTGRYTANKCYDFHMRCERLPKFQALSDRTWSPVKV